MNKKEKFVITINRELGSGGHTVGCKLAEKLNVEFYDKTLIRALTEKSYKRKTGNGTHWTDSY
jgi:shikimate kinase